MQLDRAEVVVTNAALCDDPAQRAGTLEFRMSPWGNDLNGGKVQAPHPI